MFYIRLWYSFFFLQSIPYTAAIYSSEHSTLYKDFLLQPFFFVFNSSLLPHLKSALMDLVIDSIIGPNSSFLGNRLKHSYICLGTLLCPPTAGGVYFPISCDLLWRWNVSRCCKSKSLTYIFGLAWLFCSGFAIRRTYPGFLLTL